MHKRYAAIRTIGTIYKVLGIIVGVITLLAVIAICAVSALSGAAVGQLGGADFGSLIGGTLGGLLVAIGVIIYGGIIALTLYAAGEAMYVFLALEENTRQSAEAARATTALLDRLSEPRPGEQKT